MIIFIIYYEKFKTLYLVVNNNFFPPTKTMKKKTMLFINLNVHLENVSPTIKKRKLHWLYDDQIIKEAHSTPFRSKILMSTFKTYKFFDATGEIFFVNNTKIHHTDNDIKNSKNSRSFIYKISTNHY